MILFIITKRLIERLNNLGLEIINHKDLKEYRDCKVLIRAHGEPQKHIK